MKALLSHIKFFFLCCVLFMLTSCAHQTSKNDQSGFGSFLKRFPNKRIVLLLPLQGKYSEHGKAIKNGFLDTYDQLPSSEKDSISISVLNTDSYRSIDDAYQAASEKKPDIIVGPLVPEKVNALLKRTSFPVPMLVLNQIDQVAPLNFYQFSLSPKADAQQLAEFMAANGIKNAIVIAPQTEWGADISCAFKKAWKTHGGRILANISYSHNTNIANAYQYMLASHSGTDFQHSGVALLSFRDQAVEIIPAIIPQASKVQIFALPAIYHGLMGTSDRIAISGAIFQSTPWLMYKDSLPRQTMLRLHPETQNDDVKLYGFGHDALLLAAYYAEHHTFTGVAIDGSTGYLTLGENHTINRQMLWVKLLNGQFTVIAGPTAIKVAQNLLS